MALMGGLDCGLPWPQLSPAKAPSLRECVQNCSRQFCEPPSVLESTNLKYEKGPKKGPFSYLVVMGGLEPPTPAL